MIPTNFSRLVSSQIPFRGSHLISKVVKTPAAEKIVESVVKEAPKAAKSIAKEAPKAAELIAKILRV